MTLVALALAATTAIASDPPAKPAASQTIGTVPGGAAALIAKPDFRAWAEGQYIFVVNGGDADWTGPVDVKATCTKSGVPQTPTICGNSFPNGNFFYHMANFPSGHGSLPSKAGPGQAQAVSGAGWRALNMGLPVGGSYVIVVTVDPNGKIAEKDETNNTSTQTVTTGPSAIRK